MRIHYTHIWVSCSKIGRATGHVTDNSNVQEFKSRASGRCTCDIQCFHTQTAHPRNGFLVGAASLRHVNMAGFGQARMFIIAVCNVT